MTISPAMIKKCELTWEPPDYSASYPAGFMNQGVAVIAVAIRNIRSKGECFVAASSMIFISKVSGERDVIDTEPIVERCRHSLLVPCDEAHTDVLGKVILRSWDIIPAEYKQNLVTVVSDRHLLKTLFRKVIALRDVMEYRAFERILNPYESYAVGDQHVRIIGTPAGEKLAERIEAMQADVEQARDAAHHQLPVEELEEYSVFTDCSYRSTNNKRYSKGGRMGIAGVSEDGFYFHAHYDATNIMTGELSAVLAAYDVFYHGGRQLVIHTDSLGAKTFLLRLAHHRLSFQQWVEEGAQNEHVLESMTGLCEAIREHRVIVKHVPGHTGHGLQESSDSVSKMHRHFPGQVVEHGFITQFNKRCESIITALSGCTQAVRLPCPEWARIAPSEIHSRNRLWK